MDGKIHTKGNRDVVIGRKSEVLKITLYCPSDDCGVKILMDTILSEQSGCLSGMPVSYVMSRISSTYVKVKDEGHDTKVLGIMVMMIHAFDSLRYVRLEPVSGQEMVDDYMNIVKGDYKNVNEKIYTVDELELNLSGMFSQEVIDIINKVLMLNEIIPNSYMERAFRLDFEYDEYKNYINMFLNNYGSELHQMDENICDYLFSFPEVIEVHKPKIILLTNYPEV